MTASPDHPELTFVQASGYTKGRPDGPPLWIVIHDMEANETPTTAEATANYFATGAGGRSVSSHYCADNNSIVQCVLLQDTAWTVGNRPGNYRGINWELSGFAAQTREQWLDPFGVAMLGLCAPIMRSDATRYGIPLTRRSVAELRAFQPGITSHNDLGLAFGGTDHTDPGPNFPWDYLMSLLTGTGPPQMGADVFAVLRDQGGKGYFAWNGASLIKLEGRIQDIGWVLSGRQSPSGAAGSSAFWPAVQAVGLAGPLLNVEPWITVYDASIDMLGYKPAGTLELTDEQLAEIESAAQAGAEAGAPTHAELEQAAFEGAQRAEDS